jgi:hypothetical protein
MLHKFNQDMFKSIRFFILIPFVFIFGCANDREYRLYNPKTCITTLSSPDGCSEEQANLNRAKYFLNCKNTGGTPSLRTAPLTSLDGKQPILGINCLMPNGEIRDLYGEQFKKDTGEELSN